MATLEDERDHYLSEAQDMAKRVDILMEEVSQIKSCLYDMYDCTYYRYTYTKIIHGGTVRTL